MGRDVDRGRRQRLGSDGPDVGRRVGEPGAVRLRRPPGALNERTPALSDQLRPSTTGTSFAVTDTRPDRACLNSRGRASIEPATISCATLFRRTGPTFTRFLQR